MQVFKNFAASTLAGSLAAGATSLTVQTGHGDRFPATSGADYFLVTLVNAAKDFEIVRATRTAGSDAMAIVRAQEGTTDRNWLAGDIVSLRITAGTLAQLQADIDVDVAAAIAAHEAAADPHAQYMTAAEAAAAYQPIDAQLTTLAGLTAQQATDLAALSGFIGGLLNDPNEAAALATLKAPLNAVSVHNTAHTVVAADRGKLLDCSNIAGFTVTFTPAATLGAGFVFAVRNSGAGAITLAPEDDPAELIDGAATLSLKAGESCLVVCDGAGFKTVGRTVAPEYGVAIGPIYYRETSGSGISVSVPADATKALVEVQGGGGGGGGGVGQRGGAAGGFASAIKDVVGGTTLTVTVGGGGGVDGNGGSSSVTNGTWTVQGGGTGYSGTNPGTGTGGDYNVTGQAGQQGAGDGGAGGVGGNSFMGAGGAGYIYVFEGGINGQPGVRGGGGGCLAAGGPGCVRITFFK